ncbi:hypothetical protein C1646_766764 [Rhizophagus diaphanus]|nr:hypothetical protein C1646_766764 [Rhizophagus diaphanus] [Rhizophagus sp. MUCL 43196]
MPCRKCESSVIVHKNILPIIDLSEDSNTTTTIITEKALESHLLDNNNSQPNPEEYSPIDDEYSNDDNDDHIQDIHKKVIKMYTDWKATGFGGQSENNTKWIEDTINQAISTISEKVKYPSEECHMEACYNALSNADNEEFQNKIKHDS